ncbi:MAG: sigma-54-dependent Fis family transcriptional regulator [Deltaproteobacteria bacterium]|nr:sigma-54-dependent Fis family transcriptional regulator [Deltaproteobacteria bacterium]
METRILIIDDDPLICEQLERLFRAQQYVVESATTAADAFDLLCQQDFSLALVDLRIPGTDGLSLTREVRNRWPDLDVIMITGYASIKGAVEAIKQGASDYITKPFQNEEILLATEKVLEKRRLLDEIHYLRGQLADRYSFANMVSRNPRMHEIFSQIEMLAQSDATTLLTGESGTGKELCARAIHFQGKRKAGKFVPINCAAFPDTLLESELFGYERGAFTGAIHDRIGKVELSNGGTLFLDEIESISLNMQLKLLRVLEEREIERLGANRRVKVNMRVIAATNVDLEALVASGAMREDFYYRVNVVPIRIPPLRDRIEDVPLLVGEFLRNSTLAKEKGINRVSNKALSGLMSYGWPGNVRELGNVLERSILKTNGPVIRDVDLPGGGPERRATENTSRRAFDYEVPLKEFLRRAEREYLGHVLRKYRGGISSSAKHALVDAATLHRKMKSYGLKREEFRTRGSRADQPIFNVSQPSTST